MRTWILLMLIAIAAAACSAAQRAPQPTEPSLPAPTPTALRATAAEAAPAPVETPLGDASGQPSLAADLSRQWGGGKCEGSGPVTFEVAPFPSDQIGYVLPLGLMTRGHVTPIDHQYYATRTAVAGGTDASSAADVLALADGFIVQITHRTQSVGVDIANYDRFRVVFEHTCTLWSYYDELISLAPDILQQLTLEGQFQTIQARIPVRAGQVIGAGAIIDLGVANTETTLTGFLVPEHYSREPWKIYTVDPFDYYAEPLRSTLLALSLRAAEPRGGKIDYDVDGRLVGNWFLQGTNGYAGVDPARYWAGHLAFVYDYIDPAHVTISAGFAALGDCGCESLQAGVLGNSPDPADVSADTGMVAYDLVRYDYVASDGEPVDRRSPVQGMAAKNLDDQPLGVLLVQMIEDRLLRVEYFAGKSSAEVAGFTEAAMVYER